jgi:hypothetical protein
VCFFQHHNSSLTQSYIICFAVLFL